MNVRMDKQKLCLLVVIGARADGTKEIVTLEDGFRESSQSWRELLLGLKHRGLTAPELAVADGAMGFWRALTEVYSTTRAARCSRSQDEEHFEPLAHVRSEKGQGTPGRDLHGRDAARGRECVPVFHQRIPAEIPQSG